MAPTGRSEGMTPPRRRQSGGVQRQATVACRGVGVAPLRKCNSQEAYGGMQR